MDIKKTIAILFGLEAGLLFSILLLLTQTSHLIFDTIVTWLGVYLPFEEWTLYIGSIFMVTLLFMISSVWGCLHYRNKYSSFFEWGSILLPLCCGVIYGVLILTS